MAPIRIPSSSYAASNPSSNAVAAGTGGPTWDYILKFILIGDSSVGKSSLLVRLTDDRFLTDPDPTIGVEFGSHLIQLDNGETVKVQVWDTAGSESFRSITRSYYRGAAGALLVYDITHRPSFLNAKTWLDDVRSHAEERVTVVLVGNMSDLVEDDPNEGGAASGEQLQPAPRPRSERRRSKGKKREVTTQEAREFAEQERLLFLETSAKTGQNVQEAFAQAAKDIHSKFASASGEEATLGRNARSRARNGRADGTVALDGGSGSGGGAGGVLGAGGVASGQAGGGQGYVDRTTACCVIA
ncbi:hypothetical protein ACQY0O_002217 [Thecaphora frezii]